MQRVCDQIIGPSQSALQLTGTAGATCRIGQGLFWSAPLQRQFGLATSRASPGRCTPKYYGLLQNVGAPPLWPWAVPCHQPAPMGADGGLLPWPCSHTSHAQSAESCQKTRHEAMDSPPSEPRYCCNQLQFLTIGHKATLLLEAHCNTLPG